jgi:ATP-dependent protease ClpP protease subunit
MDLEVKNDNRELYLYDDIDNISSLEVIARINDINREDEDAEDIYLNDTLSFIENNLILNGNEDISIPKYEREPIILHINCFGEVFEDGIALYNTINMSNTPILGIVDGACYSMAVPIFLACDGRYGYKHSKIMIHDVNSGTQGKGRDMERQIKNITQTRETYMSIIKDSTYIESDKIEDILERGIDWYIDSEEALDLGIFDEILDADDDFEDEEYLSKCDLCGEYLEDCECGE